jgi:hypothetical protein
MDRKSVAKWRIERQLRSVVAELSAARNQVALVKEQFVAFEDDDDDAQSRALASSLVADVHVAEEAHRHAELMREALRHAEQRVIDLEKRRDDLLSSYTP